MAYGFPHISFIGYPVAIPCAGHAGLGFRETGPADAGAIVAHYAALPAADRRMRFCAILNEGALERHVATIWKRPALVLAACDGPLWAGPLHRPGPIRALAELAIDGRQAELGLSVDPDLRRQGVGTYLVQTAARLLRPRGVATIRAYTLPGNASFLALSAACGASVEVDEDEIDVRFDVASLDHAYCERRAAQILLPRLEPWPAGPAMPLASSTARSRPAPGSAAA